ncbi:MAG: DedA family protein [Candidatus Marsarchaeota archaeon]|nr:DedA family protein [Candidatus Marsarchaeota archaeon]
MAGISGTIGSIITTSYNGIYSLIASQGYLALFVLMVLEGSSLPIPSEIVIPLAGYFSSPAANYLLSFPVAFLVILAGGTFGLAIDYYIGYFLGKDVVYKHMQSFHVKKESIDAFDAWFTRNGKFAVFITRFIPELRALMSFPAGFAKMDLKPFFIYSIAGTVIWDIMLMLFGYFLGVEVISAHYDIIIGAVAVFIAVLYFAYRIAMKKMRKK